MKGFIEITHFEDGFETEYKQIKTSLIPISSIKYIEVIRYHKNPFEAECVLRYEDTLVYPTQSYIKLKDLIKNAQ